MPGARGKNRHAKKEAFLAAYSECGNISKAADIAQLNRDLHYKWLKDPEYTKRFDAAHEQACDRLEQEARRRAAEGWDEPVVYQGQFTYEPVLGRDGKPKLDDASKPVLSKKPLCVRKFSDTLLIFLMKGAMPDKYKERFSQEISGSLDLVERLSAGRKRVAAGEAPTT